MSAALSFDQAATADADRFLEHWIAPAIDGTPGLMLATDGELYGHHQPFRDLFLDRVLTQAAPRHDIAVTSVGRWIDGQEPTSLPEATVADGTSWSCHHGIARWSSECGCTPNGHWKTPLRLVLNRLAGAIDALTEMRLAGLGLDAWACRDRFVDVASEFDDADAWADRELQAATASSGGDQSAVLVGLMRAQTSRLGMYASDAWYWEGMERPETQHALRLASHAARLVDETCRSRLEAQFDAELRAIHAVAG
jgi:hypothetical protein